MIIVMKPAPNISEERYLVCNTHLFFCFVFLIENDLFLINFIMTLLFRI